MLLKTISRDLLIIFSLAIIVVIILWYSFFNYSPLTSSINSTLPTLTNGVSSASSENTSASTADKLSCYFHLELVNSTGKAVIDNEKKIIFLEINSSKDISLVIQGVMDKELQQTLPLYSDVNVVVLNNSSILRFGLGFGSNGSSKEIFVNGIHIQVKQLDRNLFRLDIKVNSSLVSQNTIVVTMHVWAKGEYIEIGNTYTLKIKVDLG